MTRFPSRGLYALTPQRHPDRGRLVAEVAAALAGGAVALQFRDKSEDSGWRLAAANELRALCREHRVPLIVNDDIALAVRVGADGVHLGREDGPVAAAREALGAEAIIGVSCYADLDRARAAAAAGADYLAFGSLFPSPTKTGAPRCPPSVLGAARALGLPVVAIGGIVAGNAGRAIAAGADLVAVISGVFDAGVGPEQAASGISRVLDEAAGEA